MRVVLGSQRELTFQGIQDALRNELTTAALGTVYLFNHQNV